MFQKNIGKGDIKTFGGLSEKAYNKGLKEKDVLELANSFYSEENKKETFDFLQLYFLKSDYFYTKY